MTGTYLRSLITALSFFLIYAHLHAQNQKRPHLVFLLSIDPDNYEAPRTIPEFAKNHEQYFKSTIIIGEGNRDSYSFPGLKKIKKADLLVVFCRRLALPPAEINMIKKYLHRGKPLAGIRTANHAFSFRETPKAGHEAWWEFVPEILGCENRGYGDEAAGTQVKKNEKNRDHPIIKDLPDRWESVGNVYKVTPLTDPEARTLLVTSTTGIEEPIAWVRSTSSGGRVFYTSLGHPSDFESEEFIELLKRGFLWATGK